MVSFPNQLRGNVAIVTGAAYGIGLGIATVLADRGATVALGDIDFQKATEAAESITNSGGQAIGVRLDITSVDSIENFAEMAREEFGPIDICVPNAGVIGATGFAERVDHSPEDWRSTWLVNVQGTVNTVEAVKNEMVSRSRGKIVIVSSQGGRPPRGTGGMWKGTVQQPYLVSKAALIQYTHHLAIELGASNINVNAVCPGTLWTPMWEQIATNHALVNPELNELAPREFFDKTVESGIPLGRAPKPEDVGKVVAFLASDDASEITGQAINVNGGGVMN